MPFALPKIPVVPHKSFPVLTLTQLCPRTFVSFHWFDLDEPDQFLGRSFCFSELLQRKGSRQQEEYTAGAAGKEHPDGGELL